MGKVILKILLMFFFFVQLNASYSQSRYQSKYIKKNKIENISKFTFWDIRTPEREGSRIILDYSGNDCSFRVMVANVKDSLLFNVVSHSSEYKSCSIISQIQTDNSSKIEYLVNEFISLNIQRIQSEEIDGSKVYFFYLWNGDLLIYCVSLPNSLDGIYKNVTGNWFIKNP